MAGLWHGFGVMVMFIEWFNVVVRAIGGMERSWFGEVVPAKGRRIATGWLMRFLLKAAGARLRIRIGDMFSAICSRIATY